MSYVLVSLFLWVYVRFLRRGIPVPQTGCPCGTTLVSIVSVVSVLKKPTPKSPNLRPGPGLPHFEIKIRVRDNPVLQALRRYVPHFPRPSLCRSLSPVQDTPALRMDHQHP